ncbi:MAG: hypothetical protein AMS23_10655 [Bacteroides sp. SM1_62]|nr:MAG: hypothetical protein AMS23_10655 [Bacteroides sp. SM1_62]
MIKKWFEELEDLLRNGISPEQRIFANRYARKAKYHIDKVLKGVDKEAEETREMASSFFRLLEHKLNLNERTDPPSKEEVKAALEQLKDVGRFSIFVTAVILPGGVISLIGLELLARQYGINFTLIPSAFKKKKKEDDPPGHEPPPRQLTGGSNRSETTG